jgi:hypothetical protein
MRFLFAAAAIAAAVVGCGSDSKDSNGSGDNNGNDGNNETPASAEKDITAAMGGEVTVGSASISIPAGALAADTKITVESKEPEASLPEHDSLKGLIYDFGPDGTTFSKPVELKLPLPATPGEGEEAVVAWLDEANNKWVDVASTVSGGEIKANIEHFTRFVVRLRGVTAIDCSFAACGGNVVGSWNIQGACIDVNDDDNPFKEACPEATFDAGFDITGTVEFTDSTYTTTFTGSNTITVTFPASCVKNFGNLTSCAELNSTFEDEDEPQKTTSCTGDVATSCTCTINDAVDPTPKTGTYTKDGNTISMTDEGETEAETNEYCVDGNSLKVKFTEGNGNTVVLSAVSNN